MTIQLDPITRDYCREALRLTTHAPDLPEMAYNYRYFSPNRPLGRWIGLAQDYDIGGRYLWTIEALAPTDICRLELLPANGRALRLLREQVNI